MEFLFSITILAYLVFLSIVLVLIYIIFLMVSQMAAHEKRTRLAVPSCHGDDR